MLLRAGTERMKRDSVSFVGMPKSEVDTPALLVDVDTMQANMNRILATCEKHHVGWRPHCKGHKSPDIAKLEIAKGAIGVTCAKVGEAEVMAAAGIRSIVIANEVVGATKFARLLALGEHVDVVVCVDSIGNVDSLNAAAIAADRVQKVLIEVNVGMNRAGVEPGAPVLALANEIASRSGLRLVGVLAWESHATRIADAREKESKVKEALAKLTASARACEAAGHKIEIVSCGGTGTFPYCITEPGVSEVQIGGAIFSDEHYRTHYHMDFAPALTILATVTSRPTPARMILDSGRKSMSCDMAMPAPLGLPPVEAMKLSAEHCTIELKSPSATPKVGDKIEFICGYSDSTVFLHDEIVAVRRGRVDAIWPLTARGKLK